ncbi:MAG: hypothetical protein M3277_12150 [Actinomycetota bacterium]|nr:hypothetical protein [Actinomycetota bacterium]
MKKLVRVLTAFAAAVAASVALSAPAYACHDHDYHVYVHGPAGIHFHACIQEPGQ